MSAAIFDIDGTLIDPVDFHAKAWHETFAYFGICVTFEDVRSQIGKGGDAACLRSSRQTRRAEKSDRSLPKRALQT